MKDCTVKGIITSGRKQININILNLFSYVAKNRKKLSAHIAGEDCECCENEGRKRRVPPMGVGKITFTSIS